MNGADINALLHARLPEGAPLQIPPPCLVDMQGEVVEYVEGQVLRMRFPVLPRYRNPIGHMQGGFIVAALDNTLGPFSYLIAPPSATTSLNTQYLRPVTPEVPYIVCAARLVERTRGQLHLAGEARGPDDKVLALCQAVCQILPTRPAA
nr:PaaI family thioesterase [Pseudoxanthomonas sp.]